MEQAWDVIENQLKTIINAPIYGDEPRIPFSEFEKILKHNKYVSSLERRTYRGRRYSFEFFLSCYVYNKGFFPEEGVKNNLLYYLDRMDQRDRHTLLPLILFLGYKKKIQVRLK